MASIKNLEGVTYDELNREIQQGAKFVSFRYTISILIMTFRRGSDIYFIRSGESGLKFSLPYTLLTLLFGWWGIPWGPIYSIASIVQNLSGGKDLTGEVLESLHGHIATEVDDILEENE